MILTVVMFVGCFLTAVVAITIPLQLISEVRSPWLLLVIVPLGLALQNWLLSPETHKTPWFRSSVLNVLTVASLVVGMFAVLRMDRKIRDEAAMTRREAEVERCVGRALLDGKRPAVARRLCSED